MRIPVGADRVYVVYAAGGDPGSITGGGQIFPETGKAVRRPFLAYWLPISAEMSKMGSRTGCSISCGYG